MPGSRRARWRRRPSQPSGRSLLAAAEAHVIAHHAGAGQVLEQIEDFLAFAEGIHQGGAPRAHVAEDEAGERGVVDQAGQFGGDDADVFGALGHLDAGQFLHRQRVGPVVGQRADVVEPVRVGHRAEIGHVLADLLVVAVQVAEDRLQADHRLAVEHDIHAEHAVRGRVLRPERDVQQLVVVQHRLRPGPRAMRGRCGWLDHGMAGRGLLRGGRVMEPRLFQHGVVRRGLVFVIVRRDVVLAHRMVGELVPHQDPAQVGMPGEDDAEKIKDLALLELGAAPNRRPQMEWCASVVAVAGAHAQHERADAAGGRIEMIDDFQEMPGIARCAAYPGPSDGRDSPAVHGGASVLSWKPGLARLARPANRRR